LLNFVTFTDAPKQFITAPLDKGATTLGHLGTRESIVEICFELLYQLLASKLKSLFFWFEHLGFKSDNKKRKSIETKAMQIQKPPTVIDDIPSNCLMVPPPS